MTPSQNDVDAAALALLDEALDAAPEQRRALIEARAEAPEIRERALRLLTLHEEEDGQTPLTGGGLRSFARVSAPETIGAYRIESEIGRGGMGAVYLGRRMTGDFDHAAAIKLVRPNAASPAFSERLRTERQLLARLRHENIAQLYDGGETEAGEPYFIMEYVPGAPLHIFLTEQDPPLAQRLALFESVCRAIAYAHRNRVIHRDLSPANILVSDEGVAKIIDFGISHTIGQNAPGSRFTLTRGYAAPERLEGEATTTLGDIYSLGVILTELIEGVDASRRADIAAIAAKAAAHEPEKRYQSVEAILEDMARYRAGRAVAARGGGWRYETLRFVERRRLAVAAGAASLAGLIAATVIVSVLYVRADAAEQRARQQFDAVRELANFMLFDLHDEIAKVSGSTRAREMLADTGRRYLDALSASETASVDLKVETALGYKRLGDVLGNSTGANLGQRGEAGEMLRKAYAQLAALYEENPDDSAVARAYAETAFSLAVYNFVIEDDSPAALAAAEKAERAYRALAAAPGARLDDRIGVINAQAEQAAALVWMDEGEKALAIARRAFEDADTLATAHPDAAEAQKARAQIAIDLGDTMARHAELRGGDYEPALARLDDGVARYRALHESDPSPAIARPFAAALWKRALVLYSLERDEPSLADLAEAQALIEPLMESDPNDRGLARMRLSFLSQQALSFFYLERLDDAERAALADVAGRRALIEAEPDNAALRREIVGPLITLGEVRTAKGESEGCAEYREAARFVGGEAAAEETYYNAGTGKTLKEKLEGCAAGP